MIISYCSRVDFGQREMETGERDVPSIVTYTGWQLLFLGEEELRLFAQMRRRCYNSLVDGEEDAATPCLMVVNGKEDAAVHAIGTRFLIEPVSTVNGWLLSNLG